MSLQKWSERQREEEGHFRGSHVANAIEATGERLDTGSSWVAMARHLGRRG